VADEEWIIVPKWDRFQHYHDRSPAWIKVHVELLHDDAWLGLTSHQRGVLLKVWLAYAASHRQLRGTTSTLSRQLGERILITTLKALNDAGFIEFSASKPLAACYHSRTRVEELSKESSQDALVRERARGARSRTRSENGPPLVCAECGVGGGRHAADCSRAAAG